MLYAHEEDGYDTELKSPSEKKRRTALGNKAFPCREIAEDSRGDADTGLKCISLPPSGFIRKTCPFCVANLS